MIPKGNNDKAERRRFRFSSIFIQITIFSIFLFHHTTNKKPLYALLLSLLQSVKNTKTKFMFLKIELIKIYHLAILIYSSY